MGEPIKHSNRMLICSVGGSPAPVAKTLAHWQPVKVWFVPTEQSRKTIEHDGISWDGKPVPSILNAARAAGFSLDAGRYDIHELSDGEDFAGCVRELQKLTGEVERWVSRGEDYHVVVDFTGGTKCMTAALSLQASRWPCNFSYVGGTKRTKDGVGTVEPGFERVLHHANPWDALGYRAVEEFVVLFDRRAFIAAAEIVKTTLRYIERPERKRELSALMQLASAFDSWDRFDHKSCKNSLLNVQKSANDLRAALGASRGSRVLSELAQIIEHLQELEGAAPPSVHHVIDLLANAKRRREEGRFDDAVARLYRAIEAIAQVALKSHHDFESTERIPLKHVPEPLRSKWSARANNEGLLSIGLQDAYALLAALNDPVGVKFQEQGLSGAKSPLIARNRSILAHGFDRVTDSVFDMLWKSALRLANVKGSQLPRFPRLTDGEGRLC